MRVYFTCTSRAERFSLRHVFVRRDVTGARHACKPRAPIIANLVMQQAHAKRRLHPD